MTNEDLEEANIFFIDDVIKKGEVQIRAELFDYWKMMSVYSKVLDRVTNGKMSKPNYTWEAIQEVLNEIDEENQQTGRSAK